MMAASDARARWIAGITLRLQERMDAQPDIASRAQASLEELEKLRDLCRTQDERARLEEVLALMQRLCRA